MKMRLGFVSNSSASSFLLYGVMFDKYEIEETLAPQADDDLELVDINPNDEEDVEEDQDEMEGFNLYETLEELFNGTDIDVEYAGNYDEDHVYIGKSWDKVKDNQTGKEFKNEVEQIIKKVLGSKIKEMKFETLQEAWQG